ncbi:hypothetical protein J7K43_07650 [Candidatus Calescamantes bacterium]|nr:hypothetical protein [Candidatus Calescamantes bacterium]
MPLVQDKKYQEIFNQSKENWKWFEENREKLIEKYAGEFVFISDRRVIAHNPDLQELLEEVEERYRTKEHLIEYITKEGIELVL